MLTYFQAFILGTTQGISELFPVSSLGHSVILPTLLNWKIDQKDPLFLTFLVATHTATALVLFIYFWKDWKQIILGIIRSLKLREIKDSDTDAKLGWLLVTGTIPAGVLGLLFQDQLQSLFASVQIVSIVLFFNGILLLGAEFLRKHSNEAKITGSDKRITKLTYAQAIKVGLLQSLALIPGFSRTGLSITGGLLQGLTHEDAARFAFLLATPIIAAASILKLPQLFTSSAVGMIGPTICGALSAGIFSYLSIRYLTRYFQTKNLIPFAIYCILVGGGVSLFFFVT